MTTLYIWTPGDPILGERGHQATVEVHMDYVPAEVRQPFRQGLKDAFEKLFIGEHVVVAFDFELEGGDDE